jgi:hypothetical protein
VLAFTRSSPAEVELVLPRIESAIDAGERLLEAEGAPRSEDRGPLFDQLRAVAWVLPSLTTASATIGDGSNYAPDLQRRLTALADDLSVQRGLEASLAQGLKLDAVNHPTAPIDPLAVQMLHGRKRAQFWFSRMLALQACAIRQVKGRSAPEWGEVIAAARRDPHVFVREMARLCELAVVERDWHRHVWADMGTVTAGMQHRLAADATRLMGDVALLLNLNEQGDSEARRAFGRESALPWCLSRSADRGEILGAVPPDPSCPLADAGGRCRCPYVYDYERASIRRELSRVFCRHQRLTVHRVPWQRKMGRKAIQRFWTKMEDRARL